MECVNLIGCILRSVLRLNNYIVRTSPMQVNYRLVVNILGSILELWTKVSSDLQWVDSTGVCLATMGAGHIQSLNSLTVVPL